MSKVLNIWKQRCLTIFGKKLLINSLSTSLFIFNAQIDIPPVNFINLAEKLHKDFLWAGGVPKIAHHTIIADYDKGGFKYKDLNDFIAATNIKFIQNLSPKSTGHSILPMFWIQRLFKIPTGENNDQQVYFKDFFTNTINVLDCKYKLPRKAQYKGHPFYYPILKNLERVADKTCTSTENILSIPIWFNKQLKTHFDTEISRAGFNFVKDIFPYNQPLQHFHGLSNVKIRTLRSIVNKIPRDWTDKIRQSIDCFVTVNPHQTVNLHGTDTFLNSLNGRQIYSFFIANKTRLPTGLLRWREDITVSDEEIKVAFTFAQECSQLVFDHVFQYKILTQILPTSKYLKRYQVKDSDVCTRCDNGQDTVVHSISSCQLLVPYVDKIINFLKTECTVNENITEKSYIFGCKSMGLNQIFLELKKEVFYNKNLNACLVSFGEQFVAKIRKIIVKEKQIMMANNKFEDFCTKWQDFTAIYDYLGPDYQIII